LNADGTLDNSFNIGSGANSYVNAIFVQTDGKILVGGNFTKFNSSSLGRIVRLNPNGSIDNSFTVGTGFNSTIESIVLQPNGKILIGGSFTSFNGSALGRLARLNTSGTLDTTFQTKIGADSKICTIELKGDGKIYIGGSFTKFNNVSIKSVACLNSDGTVDNTFSTGNGPNRDVFKIKSLSNGKLLIGGDFYQFNGLSKYRLLRLNTDGSIDESFLIGTGVNNNVNDISIQTDGKIILVGRFMLI